MEVSIGIPEVFIGKSVFVTGGTGFIGKVLIEKILRSCPGVSKIYMLMRSRRGKTIEERFEEMSKLPLFDLLHEERPGDFHSKIVPLSGDVCELDLGLSQKDRQTLIDNVHFVYHVAATVKFDQALKDAILMNMRGTREVCNLALDMKHVKLMVHVSTAYAHTHYNPIEEKMYPATSDWRKTIKVAEKMDCFEISKVQAHFMGGFPNTYTFTKGLAERIVYDMLNGNIPNLIIRPSIIVSAWRDPLPGWIDNFNGPVGLFVANGTGLIRINLLADSKLCDFVPVDITAKAFLNATWYRLTHPEEWEDKATTVHNCAANTFSKLTLYDLSKMAHEITEQMPLSTCVWYPSMRSTGSLTVYNIYFMMLHVFPALFIDMILRILHYRPIVLMIQRRIFVAVNALKYFILNQWQIQNLSIESLEFKMLEKDRPNFAYDGHTIDHMEYIRVAISGGMRYLLKEDMTKIEKNKTKFQILKYVDLTLSILWYGFLFHLFVIKWNIFGWFYGILAGYFTSL